MKKRTYYSVRAGLTPDDQKIDFETLKKMFLILYKKLVNEGFFQKHFGIDCTDGFIEGTLGEDVDAAMFVNLRKQNLYPIFEKLPNYTEDDFFDVLEFLHDHCSKGIKGYYHNWSNCGYHYQEFIDSEGQQYFRELINSLLADYKDGYEISEGGEILILSENGLSNLIKADIPTTETDNITNKINSAILRFRKYKSTLDDRKEAIRELADVLEFLRPEIKKHLNTKDENDIFNIANNFAIRHHNANQKTEYDKAIWYSWIFYFYLATLHAILRMTNKAK
jgi:hypothetical protein